MGLTSEGFLAVVIVAVVIFPVITLLLWNRLPGPRPVQVGSRLGLIGLAQASAVLLAALWINNSYQLYTSWSDLFGQDGGAGTIAATPQVATGTQQGAGSITLPNAKLFHGVTNIPDAFSATITGPRSHIVNSVLVWLPPQYSQPAYAHTYFPVVQLLSGTPGTPQTWLQGMQAPAALMQLMQQNKAHPFILVSAAINVDPGHDPDCSNISKGPAVATWLTTDVRDLVLTSFRASPDRRSWGLMGYSEGGLCASKLVLQYPKLYAAAVSLSGDDHPDGDLLKIGTTAYNQNSPLWLLQHQNPTPNVAILLTGTYEDGDVAQEAVAMTNAARSPTVVQTLMADRGGHNIGVWKTDETPAFQWLSEHLQAPEAFTYTAEAPLIGGLG